MCVFFFLKNFEAVKVTIPFIATTTGDRDAQQRPLLCTYFNEALTKETTLVTLLDRFESSAVALVKRLGGVEW